MNEVNEYVSYLKNQTTTTPQSRPTRLYQATVFCPLKKIRGFKDFFAIKAHCSAKLDLIGGNKKK